MTNESNINKDNLPAFTLETSRAVVQSTNIEAFEVQMGDYLESLNRNPQTDEDFAKTKKDIKALKTGEDCIANLVQEIINDSVEVKEITDRALAVAEKMREVRLNLDRKEKAFKVEQNNKIISAGIDELKRVLSSESPVAESMSMTYNLQNLEERLRKNISSKRTVSSKRGAVNTEVQLIKAEMLTDISVYTEKYNRIPSEYIHLFSDYPSLILNNDFDEILEQRVSAEKSRIAEKKAKEEQEARAREERIRLEAENKARLELASQLNSEAQVQTEQTNKVDSEKPASPVRIKERPNSLFEEKVPAVHIANDFGKQISLCIPNADSEDIEQYAVYAPMSLNQAQALARQLSKVFDDLGLTIIKKTNVSV